MFKVVPFFSAMVRLAPLAFALHCASAPAAALIDHAKEAQILKVLHRDLAKLFVLDDKLALEPALRAEANEIAAAHLARMEKIMPLWLAEERDLVSAQGKVFGDGYTSMALWARMNNELALWQIDPGDADY